MAGRVASSASRYSSIDRQGHSAGSAALDARQIHAADLDALAPKRSGTEAVGVDELGRETLADLGLERRVDERPQRAVAVHVDEARGEGEAVEIDDLLRLDLERWPGRDDPSTINGHVADKWLLFSRIDGGAAQEERYQDSDLRRSGREYGEPEA